jgi:hypothetical protein
MLGLGAVLALASVGLSEAPAQRQASHERTATSAELMALAFDAGDGRQQITVVDTRQRVLAVYHVDRATGGLALKSVRNIQHDLLIEDFNSEKPTPREVRALIQQR